MDGKTTYHIWDNASNIIGEYGINTNDITVYYRGLNGEIITDGVSRYTYNGHGDTTSLIQQVDNSIIFAETYEYDAFGNTTTEGLTEDVNPFRYNGQYTDDETGLIYLRNRYYDPEIGRFISEDPIRDGLNWYVYCSGNPVAFVDPWGLAGEIRYVVGDNVRFRTAPGTSSNVNSLLSKGTAVDYTGNKTGNIDGHMWAEVSHSGITGWVAADYLGIAPPGTVEEISTWENLMINTNSYIYIIKKTPI